MKLCDNTIAILTSFSHLNKSIMFKKGNIVKTKPDIGDSPSVKAKIKEEFPVDFAIYEFKKFLQILALFDEPDLDFKDTHVIITDSNSRKSTIYYDDARYVTNPNYEKDFKLPTVDCSFDIEYDTIQSVIRSAKTMGHSEISIKGVDGTLSISTYSKNSNDRFSIELGETDKTFNMIFSIADFSMVKVKYNAELSFKGIAKFESDELIYWVAPSQKSTYA